MRRDELLEAGRTLRSRVSRRSHGEWRPADDRRDPVEILAETNANRLPELVPIRQDRMTASPFAYYRGAPAVMAADLSTSAATGITLQICGDAHLLNFGSYATPERNLVFDVNDFDETQHGPWEWDVKRLAASLMVAARTAGLADSDGQAAVVACAATYRTQMAAMSELSAFDVWHSQIDMAELEAAAKKKRMRAAVARGAAKARRRTSMQALEKLTTVEDGKRRIVEDPPLVVRLSDAQIELARHSAESYLETLEADRRALLDHYEFVDAAMKVVGVGSVGTRCFIALFAGKADLDPLFLQLKEAQASVLAPYVGPSGYDNHGRRVVVGQRIMQAASDPFLGWTRVRDFDLYVRQLRDMKFSVDVEDASAEQLTAYAKLCGATLARAHARAGEPALLAGYLGKSSVFDDALASFAVTYADQNERDYERFCNAVGSGRLQASAEASAAS